MTECYRCGQEGHTRSQCPGDVPLPPAAPARGGTAERRYLRAVPDPHGPERTRKWVDIIRDTLGFPPPDKGETS